MACLDNFNGYVLKTPDSMELAATLPAFDGPP
jgi:hypothetical protein